MDAESQRIAPERLFAQRRWVEGLAEGLVGKGDAEDLAQDAIIAAMEKPPRRQAALRPWLRSVVHNLALQWRRTEGRRRNRQRAAAKTEGLPATDVLVERAELQSMLAEEVVALDEPYKTAVLLRYFEGLSAAEIARRTGTPAGTVRSHLSRGLERLRLRLDDRHGGRREVWSAAVAGLANGVRTSSPPVPFLPKAVPTIWKGLLAMKGISLVVGVLAVAAAVGIWITGREAAATHPDISPTETHAAAPIAPEKAASAVSAVDPAEHRVVVAETSEKSPLAAETQEEPALLARITARLADPDGRSLANAVLETVPEEYVVDHVSAATGTDGSVELAVAKTGTVTLRASHPDYADRHEEVVLVAGESIPLGELRLPHAGRVTGLVQDEAGRPLAGARVHVTGLETERRDPEELRRHGPMIGVPVPTALTDAAGRFHVSAPIGHARVWAGAEGMAWSSFGPLEVRREETSEEVVLDLVSLRADDRIAGIVLSPEGEPVAGVGISYFYHSAFGGSGGNTRTGDDGSFSIVVEQRAPHRLWIGDPQDRWSRIVLDEVQPGTTDLELAFSEPRWIEIEVTDEAGRPVEHFSATAESAGGWHGSSEHVRDGQHAEGRARMRVPTHPFHVAVDARGFEKESQGPFEVDAPPERLAFTVTSLPGIHGRVVDADGEPITGAAVELMQVYDYGMLVYGFPTRVDRQWQSDVQTDADGGFVHYAAEVGEYVLRAEVDGLAPTIHGPFDVDPQYGVDGLELVVSAGGTIEGRVLVPPGTDAEGIILGVNDGFGYPQTIRTGPKGSFRIEHLTPGPWEIEPVEAEIDPERFTASYGEIDRTFEPDCDVYEGRITRFDIDLRDAPACVVAGSFALGEADLSGWTASLEHTWSETGSRDVAASGPIDETGRFRLETKLAATYALVLRGPETPNGRLVIVEELALQPGERTWELALESGRVLGEGAFASTTDFFEYRWSRSDGGREIEATARIQPDASGAFELSVVPAGAAKIVGTRPVERGGRRYSRWETLTELELEPGATESVRLP